MLRAIGVLFLLIGAFVAWIAVADPAPPDTWLTANGRVAAVEWSEGKKTGRRARLELTSRAAFATDHLEHEPDLERRLRSVVAGDLVDVAFLRSDLAPSAQPPVESLLRLRRGEEVLLDRAGADAQGSVALVAAMLTIGTMLALAGLGLLLLGRRLAGRAA